MVSKWGYPKIIHFDGISLCKPTILGISPMSTSPCEAPAPALQAKCPALRVRCTLSVFPATEGVHPTCATQGLPQIQSRLYCKYAAHVYVERLEGERERERFMYLSYLSWIILYYIIFYYYIIYYIILHHIISYIISYHIINIHIYIWRSPQQAHFPLRLDLTSVPPSDYPEPPARQVFRHRWPPKLHPGSATAALLGLGFKTGWWFEPSEKY